MHARASPLPFSDLDVKLKHIFKSTPSVDTWLPASSNTDTVALGRSSTQPKPPPTRTLSHTPGVNLAQGDVQPLSDVLNRLIALGDDAHTFGDGFGCDGVVSCDHDHLKTQTEGFIK